MKVTCFFDYTCSYSYRAWQWFEQLMAAGENVHITWSGFVLREVNRSAAEPSPLDGPAINSVAVLALALHEALAGRGTRRDYHSAMFRAMHASKTRAGRDDILRIARDAGIDDAAFRRNETAWLDKLRGVHRSAVHDHGVFGTPTLMFEDGAAMYLKLCEVPLQGDRALWDALQTICVSFPQVVELKRPQPTTA